MLNENVFIEKIAELMAWYVNFRLDLFDKDENGKKVMSYQFQLWYSAFEKFSNQDFTMMIDTYKRENIYPPSSPTSITSFIKEQMKKSNGSHIESAWQSLENFIQSEGFGWAKKQLSTGEVVDYQPLKIMIKKYGDKKLEKVYDMMLSKLRDMNDYNKSKIRDEFASLYADLLMEEISENINQGKLTRFLMSDDDKLKLE
jgi:hypothetical protein